MVVEVKDLRLGAKVAYRRPLRRAFRELPARGSGWPSWMKVWEPIRRYIPGGGEEPEVEGIVVGVRTLANGHRIFYGSDEPVEFRATEHFAALLVAHDLRRRPVFVRPEDVRLVEA